MAAVSRLVTPGGRPGSTGHSRNCDYTGLVF